MISVWCHRNSQRDQEYAVAGYLKHRAGHRNDSPRAHLLARTRREIGRACAKRRCSGVGWIRSLPALSQVCPPDLESSTPLQRSSAGRRSCWTPTPSSWNGPAGSSQPVADVVRQIGAPSGFKRAVPPLPQTQKAPWPQVADIRLSGARAVWRYLAPPRACNGPALTAIQAS